MKVGILSLLVEVLLLSLISDKHSDLDGAIIININGFWNMGCRKIHKSLWSCKKKKKKKE